MTPELPPYAKEPESNEALTKQILDDFFKQWTNNRTSWRVRTRHTIPTVPTPVVKVISVDEILENFDG